LDAADKALNEPSQDEKQAFDAFLAAIRRLVGSFSGCLLGFRARFV
jgi:hypothetical protein